MSVSHASIVAKSVTICHLVPGGNKKIGGPKFHTKQRLYFSRGPLK